MGLLSHSQKDAFWNDGVLVVEDAVSDTPVSYTHLTLPTKVTV